MMGKLFVPILILIALIFGTGYSGYRMLVGKPKMRL